MTHTSGISGQNPNHARRQFLKQTFSSLAAVTVIGGISGATAIVQPQPDVTRMSATQISAAIRRRDISALDVVENFLTNLQRNDQKLLHEINAATARTQARAVDTMIARDAAGYGPLLGVPIVVDVKLAVAGFTHGNTIALKDDVVIQRLRAAGAIVSGTTSAGAAAVATGLIPLAIAADDGNTRINTATAAVYSGHVPMVSAVLCESIGVQAACGLEPGAMNGPFPVARDIHDIELLVQLIAGLPGHDRVAGDEAALTFTSFENAATENMHIAWLGDTTTSAGARSDIFVRGAAKHFLAFGAEINSIDFAWQMVQQSHIELEHPADAGTEYQQQMSTHAARRHASWQQLDQLLDQHDVLASPATLVTNNGVYASSTLISWLGFPTITIPCGLLDGLPQTMQLTARAGNEQQLYRAAAVLARKFSKHGRLSMS